VTSALTLADAARMMRDALRDRSYRATPLGLEARYYRWKRNEWGARPETLRDHEAILAKLALDHADLEIADFEPPMGTERLREFIDNRWGDRTARTRAKVISVLRDFFAWAVRERGLTGNPAIPIFRPGKQEVARGTFTASDVQTLLSAQTRQRERVALLFCSDSASGRVSLPGSSSSTTRAQSRRFRARRQGSLSTCRRRRAEAHA
jgi:hypothetical protein